MALYAYFGYPASLLLVGLFRNKRVQKKTLHPSVSLIITAYNEEKRIEAKLVNTLELDYPPEKLQIIVTSDGSTDRTNEIARRYHEKGVELLVNSVRRGKEYAQKDAVGLSKGEVLVFTDVATLLEPGSLKEMVSNFSDPSVGCVSSEDRLVGKDGKPSGEGFYVRYEMWLRRLESKVNSLVGLSGSFFAARREVCQDFANEMQSDFRTVLNAVRSGLRAISDPKVIGYYHDISDEKGEFERKVRTVLRGLTVFFHHPDLLNPFRYGLFSYQYFCHKLLRWSVPVLLCIAFISNLMLVTESGIFISLFVGQCCFYLLAIIGWMWPYRSSKTVIRIPHYFLTVNTSILVAWWRYLRGQRVVMWTPSGR